MSKKEKLIRRLLARPKDFTFDEAKTLLGYFDYDMEQGVGSRVKFDREGYASILLHKPHPGNVLREYQVKQLLDSLRGEGLV